MAINELGCGGGGNFFGQGMMGGYGFGFGPIFQIIIVILFLLVVLWLFRSGRHDGYRAQKGETAMEILEKRLATGEITKKEFESIKKEISKK